MGAHEIRRCSAAQARRSMGPCHRRSDTASGPLANRPVLHLSKGFSCQRVLGFLMPYCGDAKNWTTC